MESHKRVLGILYIISGTLLLMTMFFLAVFFSTIFTFALREVEPDKVEFVEMILGLVQYIPGFVIVLFAVPSIIAGVGLLARKDWAMILALIMGCFKLFSFPIGTALGIYTIWVYAEDQKMKSASQPS